MKRKLSTSALIFFLLVSNAAPAAASLTDASSETLPLAPRDQVTYAELVSPAYSPSSPVDNSYFLPVGENSPALHELQGTLTVPRVAMQKDTLSYNAYRFFPGFSVDFFTYGGYLVPAVRELIVSPGDWSLILAPGKVWSEPGDMGLSRASFPFTLGSPPDRLTSGDEAHNGVATFLFNDTQVSSFRFQVTQETAPDGDIFDMWGQFPLEYDPGSTHDYAELEAEFEDELAQQMPVRPWTDLESLYDPEILSTLTAGLPPESVSAAGIVMDGVIYLQPSMTRFGEYPYPRYMHHAGMSISKSIGAGIALLWLGQRYGLEVFDLKIVDYLNVSAAHTGWEEVTFGDVLNMATGVGDNAPTRRPFDPYANESGANYRDWYLAETTAEKLAIVFRSGNYPWGPGELLRYTSSQTFVLSAAMDAYLKSQAGPNAHLWETLLEDVFQPIGVRHMTMIHVPNGDGNPGIPLLASGLRVTIDDIGKIVTLLQAGGQHNGQQLLSAPKLAEALYRTDHAAGLPSGKTFAYGDQSYLMSFWAIPHRTQDGRMFQVPFMSGAGGNTVFLAPNGISTFVFTDHGIDSYSLNIPALAEVIRPYPGAGIRSGLSPLNKDVTLIPENRRQLQVVYSLLLSWILLTAVSVGAVIWDTARSQPGFHWSRLAWVLMVVIFGPLGLAVYWFTYRRKQHAALSAD